MSSKHSGTSDHRLRGSLDHVPLRVVALRHVVKPIHNTSPRACSAYLRHHMPLGEVLCINKSSERCIPNARVTSRTAVRSSGFAVAGVMQFPIRKINLLAFDASNFCRMVAAAAFISSATSAEGTRRSGTPAPTCLIFSSSKIAAPAYFSTVQECLEERVGERFSRLIPSARTPPRPDQPAEPNQKTMNYPTLHVWAHGR